MTYYTAPGIKNLRICPAEFTEAMRISYAQDIITEVAKFYDVSMEKILKKGRKGNAPIVRQMASYIIRQKVKGLSLIDISQLFGDAYLTINGHDHSAIIHNFKKIQGYIDVSDNYGDDYETLMQII